jgi:hypothetical protein
MVSSAATLENEPGDRSDPRVRKLTTEILALHTTAERDYAETVVEIGTRLRAVRLLLRHGEWLAWLEMDVPFTAQSATNYIDLADWAEEHASDFMRFKQLGPTKLYAIMTLGWRGLRVLRTRQTHPVPGSDRALTLQQMSAPQLYRLVATLRDGTGAEATIDYVVRGYRQRLTRLHGATERLVSRRAEVDTETAAELHQALLAAARQLAEAFQLSAPRTSSRRR